MTTKFIVDDSIALELNAETDLELTLLKDMARRAAKGETVRILDGHCDTAGCIVIMRRAEK